MLTLTKHSLSPGPDLWAPHWGLGGCRGVIGFLSPCYGDGKEGERPGCTQAGLGWRSSQYQSGVMTSRMSGLGQNKNTPVLGLL